MKTSRISVLRQVKRYALLQKSSIIMLMLISTASIPVALISPYFFQILIDRVIGQRELSMFWVVVIGLFSVYILRFILDGGSLFFGNRLLNRFTFSLRADIFEKYQTCPYQFLEKKDAGDLKMRIMDDVDCLGSFIKDQVVDYIFSILMAVFSLLVCLWLNWQMCLYCLIAIPFIFIINDRIGRGAKKVNEEIRQVKEEYISWTHDTLQSWREIKIQNTEESVINRFGMYRSVLAKLGLRSIRFWAYSEIFNDFKVNYLTRVMVYIIGAFFILENQLTVGELILFTEVFALLFNALDTVNRKNMELRMNTPYYVRIFETLQFPNASSIGKQEHEITGTITVQGLTFGYNEENTLENIHFTVNAGETLAVIGKSGSGKSTLVKLLLGLYQPCCGTILYDGVPLESMKLQSLYMSTGIVMQDCFLFDMTIRENLCLAYPTATDADLERACLQANILPFIHTLPEGFETVIGERGIKLSGGQKQRLCIARALLKKPKILILDEATSALDQESEDTIMKNIPVGMTVIIITHRPASVHKTDRVFVIGEAGNKDDDA